MDAMIVYDLIRKINRRYPALILFVSIVMFSLSYVLTVVTEGLSLQWDKWFFTFAFGCLLFFVITGYITFSQTLYIKEQKSILLTSIISSILLTSPLYIFFKSLFDDTKIQIGIIITIFISTSIFMYIKIKNRQTAT